MKAEEFKQLPEESFDEKEMIIYARKYLHDAYECISYSKEQKDEILKVMRWLKSKMK